MGDFADAHRQLKWGETLKKLFRVHRNYFQNTDSDRCVKVAILDTGIDWSHPKFQGTRLKPLRNGEFEPVRGERNQIDRIMKYRNFCNDGRKVDNVTDIDGHGTHVAGIILQFAPTAELYIARVCQGDGSDLSNEMSKRQENGKKIHPNAVEKVGLTQLKTSDSADFPI